MIYDAIHSQPAPQASDIKTEKNHVTEEPRAIEDSDKSGDADLDIDRQNIAKESRVEDILKDGDMELEAYNAKGSLTRDLSVGDHTEPQHESIDLIV